MRPYLLHCIARGRRAGMGVAKALTYANTRRALNPLLLDIPRDNYH